MVTTFDVSVDRPYVPPRERSTVFADVSIDPGSQGGTATRQLVICVDRSGSMKGEKIENARDGASRVLGLLNDDDYLGVVSFNSRTSVDLQMGQYGDRDRAAVESTIDDISASGGTDIYGALEQSRDLLQGLPGGQDVAKRILLLSDGSDNNKDAPEFEGLATEIGNSGISIVSAGLGSYDQPTIKTIGESSQGKWDHLQNPGDVLSFFGDAIEEAGKTRVSNPQLRIDGVQGVEIVGAYRRLPQVQEVTLQEGSGVYAVSLPDLLDREKQQVMFELEIPARDEGKVKLADVSFDAGTESKSAPIVVEYTSDTEKQNQRDLEVWAKYQDADARTTLASAETEMDIEEAKQQTEMVEAVAGDTRIATDLRDSVTTVAESDCDDEVKDSKNKATKVK